MLERSVRFLSPTTPKSSAASPVLKSRIGGDSDDVDPLSVVVAPGRGHPVRTRYRHLLPDSALLVESFRIPDGAGSSPNRHPDRPRRSAVGGCVVNRRGMLTWRMALARRTRVDSKHGVRGQLRARARNSSISIFSSCESITGACAFRFASFSSASMYRYSSFLNSSNDLGCF